MKTRFTPTSSTTTPTRSTPVTTPDDDYEDPVGEVLDEDTARELAASNLVSRLCRLFGIGDVRWPFI